MAGNTALHAVSCLVSTSCIRMCHTFSKGAVHFAALEVAKGKQLKDPLLSEVHGDMKSEAWVWRTPDSLRRALQMMKVELTKFNKRFGVAKMAAKAYVGKEMCCEAELTLIMGR